MDVSSILEKLGALNKDFVQKNDQATRELMLVAAQNLVTSLQTPSDFISHTLWAEPARSACVRTALDLGIFEKLAQDDSQEGVEISQIAAVKGADTALVSRIVRHLTAMGVVREVSHNRFANTMLSGKLAEPVYKEGVLICYDVFGPALYHMPDYFTKAGYGQVTNPTDGPFQFAHDTQDHFWPWLSQHPPRMDQFAHYMSRFRGDQMPWYNAELYPFKARVIEEYSQTPTTVPFIVDVAGGRGQDLVALSTTFGSFPGPAFLQDLPEVIANSDPALSDHQIKTMTHDFFTPQPIIGARAYLLNSILHDWEDEDCIRILKGLKSAMKPGFSKLLVRSMIVPDKNATWSTTSMDLLMMALLAARERTEAEFRHLFDSAGLKIDKIWVYEGNTEGVIEASLPA